MSESVKTALVVLYNHNFERNIPTIRKIYSGRFSHMVQLMPFYYGNEPDVLSVFGSSFYFNQYIAQVRRQLQEMDVDNYLIIGDDLLLNPSINENNVCHELGIDKNSFYIDDVVNISEGKYYRATTEAHNFSMWPLGIDGTANRAVPSYEEAFETLKGKGLINSTSLYKYAPFYPEWKKPFMANSKSNYHIFKARVFHWLKKVKYFFARKKFSYPCIFGYSDIIVVPKTRLDEFCHYQEVFSTWKMFVELAIPTSIMLMKDTDVRFCSGTTYKTGNVWYPQDPKHQSTVSAQINTMLKKADERIDNLQEAFPTEYLYLHPVKLSKLS